MVLALMIGGSILLAHEAKAAEKQRGRSIEFSDRKSSEVATNLNQMGSRKDGLRQLEDDLGKPFQTFNPKSSLDGVFNVPTYPQPNGPVIPSKRARELLDKQKNWIFLTPEDIGGALKEEEIFKFRKYDKDGQEKKEATPLEKFMEREEAERNPNSKKNDKNEKMDSKEYDLTAFVKRKEFKPGYDESALPESLRDSEQSLKKLFDSDSPSSLAPVSPANSFSDVFGLGSSAALKPATENPNIAKYRELLDQRAPVPANPFGAMSGVSSMSPLDSFGARHDSFTPAPAFGTVSLPTGPSFFDAKSLNPAPASRIDTPRIGPPTPTFAVPQRKF